MKKLNKSERHSAYMIMLAELEAYSNLPFHVPFSGFCGLAKSANILYEFNRGKLKELSAKKPKRTCGAFWFPRCQWTKRISILKKCINETA